MKTPDIVVTETPGLREIVSHDAAGVSTADLHRVAQDFLLTTGVSGSEFGTQLFPLVVPIMLALQDSGDSWDRFKDLFRPLREVVVGTETHDVAVGFYWLDVPRIRGCTGSLTVTVEHKTDIAASVKIAGIGGGPEFSITLTNEIAIDPSRYPQLATATMPFTFEHVEYRVGKRVTASFPRLVQVDKTRMAWRTDKMSAAGRPKPGTIIESPSFDVRGGSALSQKLTVNAGTSWEFDLGVELKAIGFESSLKLTGSYEQSVELDYKLASGHSYRACRYEDRPGYWWS